MSGDINYLGRIPPRIRVYRSGALSTGGDGTLVDVPWDAESVTPAKSGFTHSNSTNPERITADSTGSVLLLGGVLIGSGTWSRFRVEVQVSTGGGAFVTRYGASVSGGAFGVLDTTVGPGTCPIHCPLDLLPTDVMRVQCASIGEATVALMPGEFLVWLEVRGL